MKTVTAAVAIAAALGFAAFFSASTPAAASEVLEHEVRSGDNLHLIAGYYYRDPRQWKRIWRSNRQELRNANRLTPGQVLRVETDQGAAWDIPYEEFRARASR